MDEFRLILKELGMKQRVFSDKIGLKYASVRKGLCHGSDKGGNPTWAKSFVLGFNLGVIKGEKNGSKKKDPSGSINSNDVAE